MGTDIRKKFENYLILNRMAPKTQISYLGAITGLAQYYNLSPDKLDNEQIQQYLVYLIRQRKLKWSSCNVAFCAINCFYARFLNRPKTEFCIPPRPRNKRLPEVLNQTEVKKIIEAAKDLRHQSVLMMTYGSGLRVGEVVKLQRDHIDSERMLVRVEQAKGRKDRYTLLSTSALENLRLYWKVYRPGTWIFYGRSKDAPMAVATAQRIFRRSKKASGLTKGKGIHCLRHCFATHLLEQGVDIYMIKRFLGHRSIQSTLVYLHVVPNRTAKIKSPLDNL